MATRSDPRRIVEKIFSDSATIKNQDFYLWNRAVQTGATKTFTLPTPVAGLKGMEMWFTNASSGILTLACTNGFLRDDDSVVLQSKQEVKIECVYIGGTSHRWVVNPWPGTSGLTVDELAGINAANSPSGANAIATMADLADELSTDELAGIQGANSLSAANPAATMADIPADELSADELAGIQGANSLSAANPAATVADLPITDTPTGAGALIAGASTKNPPIDADSIGFVDSEATNILKKATWTQIKAFLKTYFDTLYPAESTTTVGTLVNGATLKATPVDADIVGFVDTEAENIIKKATWTNIKAFLKTYFDTQYPAETTTTVGSLVNGATAKATPIDADIVGFVDTQASNVIKKATWTDLKAFLKTYFDTLYMSETSGTWTWLNPAWDTATPAGMTITTYRCITTKRVDWWLHITSDDPGSGGGKLISFEFATDMFPVDLGTGIRLPVMGYHIKDAGAADTWTTMQGWIDAADATPANRKVTLKNAVVWADNEVTELFLYGSHPLA